MQEKFINLQALKEPKYRYTTKSNSLIYKFTSAGPKGDIKKIVIYSRTQTEGVYNLAFGNDIECDSDLDDLAVSDNHDTQKVLATVVSTLQFFLKKHANAWVFAKGSTKSRTRLYRIGISRNLVKISKNFVILGYLEMEGWELFALNKDYDSFMITRRQKI